MPACPTCGSEIAADHRYCPSCGTQVSDETGDDTSSDTSSQQDDPSDGSSSNEHVSDRASRQPSQDTAAGQPSDTQHAQPGGPGGKPSPGHQGQPGQHPPGQQPSGQQGQPGQHPPGQQPSGQQGQPGQQSPGRQPSSQQGPPDLGSPGPQPPGRQAHSQGGPPSPAQRATDDDGVSRRTLLLGGAGLTAVLAGGFVIFAQGSDDDDDPESVLKRFYQALYSADAETANELLHDDNPDGLIDVSELSESRKETLEASELTVEGTTHLPDELTDDDRTVVEIEYTIDPPDESERTETQKWELRTQDGDWKVWSPYPQITVSSTPAASFEFDYDSAASRLSISHDGGATMAADQLLIEGTNIEREGAWYTFTPEMGPTDEISAGDSIDLTAQSDYDVSLVWESDRGNKSTLGTDSGPDA